MSAEFILTDGGVVIYPADTVYGISCDIFNQKQSSG